MDLSSVPVDQQKELQQLNQLFQEHLQNKQHHLQQQQQSYDPSSSSYYADYYQHHHQQSSYNYGYYHPDYYASDPNYQSAHLQGQGQSFNSHFVPEQMQRQGYLHHHHLPSEPVHNQLPDLVHGNEIEYNPSWQGGQAGYLRDSGYQARSGLTPAAEAAVAALSQLTQFASSMGAREKAMGTGQGQLNQQGPGQFGALPVYRGSGRRGGRSFRGRGPRNFNNGPSFTGPPFCGRGRGRGRASFGHTTPDNPSSSSHPNNEVAEPVPDNPQEAKQGTVAPNKLPSQAFSCELCRVDCNTSIILEQHKNGKKHKKNLEKSGQLQPSVVGTIPQSQLEEISVSKGENLATESVDLENAADKQTETKNHAGDLRHGTKRKMRGGKGVRSSKRKTEPPKPKVVIPLICDLCNVKCDTQEVFDKHLAGKKHSSKLKRYEGHQSIYGPLGLQALYPPNPISQTLAQPQICQHAGPLCSVPHPEPYVPTQSLDAAPLAIGGCPVSGIIS